MTSAPPSRAGLAAADLETLREMLRSLGAALSIGLEDRIERLQREQGEAMREMGERLARLETLVRELPGRTLQELDRSEWAVAAPTVARSRRR